jgi:predicted dehydrogenase
VTQQLRVGVVGTGGLGAHMAGQFAAVEGVTIAAVTDVSEENRREVGERFDVPAEHRYEGYAKMFDEADLDVAQVTTPHTLHAEQVLAALDRGLHVYCEKPLATSLDDAREIRDRVDATGLTLMVGYQRHLDPAFLRGRERWAEGEREPAFVTAEITQPLWDTETWYTNPDLSGGGQIYATGTHVIDAILWMTDEAPASVTASLTLDEARPRMDKHAALTIELANGCVVSLGISGDTPGVREHVHGWDNEGALYIEGREWDPRKLTVIDAEGTEHSPHLGDPEQSKGAAFVEAVRADTQPPATVRDALRATAVQEAAYEADETGERVDIDADLGLDR